MTMTVNASEADIIRLRRSMALAYGGGLDAKRPDSWTVFGYTETVTFENLLTAYKRGGAAHGAVHRLLDKCWQEWPRIKSPDADEETPFEQSIKDMFKRLRLWPKLKEFDRRNLVGFYAGLIYRVADGLSLEQPLGRGELVDVVPVFQDQIKVTEWVLDKTSPDYGKPAMFQYRRKSLGENNDQHGRPDEWADVHPSRVQMLAEGSVGGNFLDGVPLLEAGFNSLVDLEKISGGSAESFLKNSARTLVIKFNGEPPQMLPDPDTGETVKLKTVMEDQVSALNSNIDKSLVLGGADASTLQTAQHDPTGAFQLAANNFAASVRIPFTVLFGQQTGRLASNEDKADMLARAKSRQETELTPMLDEFMQRMQAIGAIEAGEFEIEWPDLGAPTDDEKLTKAEKMTKANQAAGSAGMPPIFDDNEIRKAAGYEERTQLPPLPPEPVVPDPLA